MDSFQSIRNPITLVHTPLRAACDDSCPEDIKKMLSLVIRNIDCLDEHLTTSAYLLQTDGYCRI